MAEIYENAAVTQCGATAPASTSALDALDAAVCKQPLNREIMRKTLAYCVEERPLHDVEREIQTYPEFPHCTQNPYHLVMTLVGAGGLSLVERDEGGVVVTAEDKEGLTEDEIDDLVAQTSFVATDTGRAYVARTAPAGRIEQLFNDDPSLHDAFVELLAFTDGEARSYLEIDARFKGRRDLDRIINGHRESMQASVLVDKLERAGALVFDGGWRLTDDGAAYLARAQACDAAQTTPTEEKEL